MEQRRDRVRQFLLKRLAGGVSRPSSGWLDFLSRKFFSRKEGTYAFEYDECDAERESCTGAVRRAWLICRTACMRWTPSLTPSPATVHFYIAPDGDWVIMASLAGPRAGSGGRYRVTQKGEGFMLAAEGNHWRA